MMVFLWHIRVIIYNTPWCNNIVGVIQLILLVTIHLVLHIIMVKVVWFLIPPTFPPKKLIVSLMVLILCHITVGIFHPWVIPKKAGPLICYLLVGVTNLVLMMMVEVVLFLVPTTYPPRNFIWSQTGMIGGFIRISIVVQHTPCSNLVLDIIHLVLLVIIHFMLLLYMIHLVWVLGQPTFNPKKLVVGLIVVICVILEYLLFSHCSLQQIQFLLLIIS